MINSNVVKYIGYAVGAVATGLAAYTQYRNHKLCRSVGVSLDAVKDLTPEQIQAKITDSMVTKAVNDAVQSEVYKVAKNAAESIAQTAKAEVTREVHNAVQNASAEIRPQVTAQLETQVKNIDVASIREDLVAAGKKEMMSKLKGCMDGILHDFSENLGNIKSIYGSISDALAGKPAEKKNLTFTLG